MALSLIMDIPNLIDKQTIDGEFEDIPVYPRCIWNDVAFRDRYMTEVNRKMELLLPVDIDTVSKSNAQQAINTLCDNLCQAIHESASKALPKPSKNVFQKPHKNNNGGTRIAHKQGDAIAYSIIYGSNQVDQTVVSSIGAIEKLKEIVDQFVGRQLMGVPGYHSCQLINYTVPHVPKICGT